MLSVYSKVLSFILVLLGYPSCESFVSKDEYGVPSARFKVKGKIVDAESEEHIVKNIKVVIGKPYKHNDTDRVYYLDSINTDIDGVFRLSVIDFPESQKFVLRIEDADGAGNGRFVSKMEDVEFKNPTFTNGSGNWYKGEAEQDLEIIKITPVKAEQ
jgi:putative lipoprotein (rSAM/lipoprotein system)